MRVDSIGQPTIKTTRQAIEGILSYDNFDDLGVAAAYITSSGLFDLSKSLENNFPLSDKGRTKRWITSFDYLRTEPVALEALLKVPSSSVKIFEPEVCLSNQGMPRVPFHPKAYLFRKGPHLEFALAGSGNLSRSGLSKGFEAGFVVGIDRSDCTNASILASVDGTRDWFEGIWGASTCLTDALLSRYTKLYESAEHLRNPAPTEDDIANGDTSKAAMSSRQLQKLRVCRTLWIDAGNITRNRGPNLPGNQLMMKRMTRVFFGFDSVDIPENSQLGDVAISYNGGAFREYSLTYSDNKMDKLGLPIPGADGPVTYDNLILEFKRVGLRRFVLAVHARSKIAAYQRKSNALDGSFRMASGREWGVY